MAFTAKDVKELRDKTGVGMMECKKALAEADGDMDKAIDILRERGLASSAKKASRVAAEGLVVTAVDKQNKLSAIVEVNCETDFVAGNPEFKALCEAVAKTVLETKPADLDALLAATISGGSVTVEEAKQELFLKVRENMNVRRFAIVEGVVADYIHMGGSVGVLVSFDTDDATADKAEFAEMGKNVAMQIAAMKPAYLNQAAVPAEVIDHEKEIMVAQMKEDPKMANKPDQVLAKIVEGKVGKYYKENCLLEQVFVRSDIFEGNVGGYINSVSKALGAEISCTGFVIFVRGEGIEKKQEDFAAEIASMIQ